MRDRMRRFFALYRNGEKHREDTLSWGRSVTSRRRFEIVNAGIGLASSKV